MNKFNNLIRTLLLKLLKTTRQKKRSRKTTAKKKPILFRELDFPAWVIGLVIFILTVFILWGQFNSGIQSIIGMVIMVSIVVFIFTYYLDRYNFGFRSKSELVMLEGLIMVSMVMLIVGIKFLAQKNFIDISGYFVPVSSGIMLITMLVGIPMALISLSVLGILLAIVNNFNFNFFLVSVAGGLVAIYSTHSVRNRRDITRAGIFISLANTVAILVIYLIHNELTSPLMKGPAWKDIIWGVLNGFVSAILAMGFLPYLEDLFSLVTNIKLMEIADFNQPLLKRLMLESPGTYHHSLLVGNLAETAAEVIGADSLLARVGAYYHDIGKLTKPEYFTENQGNLFNKHEELSPNMSSLILISHVKDGVDLANKYNLNKMITDIIEQHHGTGLIHYFYMKALEKDDPESVEETKYRYFGPKPKTVEAAIVMLADSVEAAVRTMEEPSYEQISNMVRTVINNKFTDGQLDDCNITLVNLHKIAGSFVNILKGIYHTRIEYDTAGNGNRDTDSKPSK